MKRILTAVAVVFLMGLAAMLSVTGGTPSDTADDGANAGELAIEVGRRNPWTHLRLNNDAREFRFAIVTDRTGGRRPGVFAQAVQKLNLLQPEFVMSVGDLIEGYTEDPGMWALEWAEFEDLVDDLEMPFFFCAGNHDITNVPMSEEWRRKFGRSWYKFVYRDVLFLVLNTEDPPVSEEKEIPYRFSREQRRWVREVLAAHPDVRWTFVFLHKPTWTYNDVDHAALGWTEIEQALADRPYTVFAGHKHTYARFIRRGREYYMLATTGGSSPLTGLAEGRFDHFVWVTMKDTGPVISNILLDGVQSRDIRTLPAQPVRKKKAKRKAGRS